MFVTSAHSARLQVTPDRVSCVSDCRSQAFALTTWEMLQISRGRPIGRTIFDDEHQHQPSTMEQEWSPNMGMGLYGTIWDYGTLRPLPYLLDEKGEYRNPYDAG